MYDSDDNENRKRIAQQTIVECCQILEKAETNREEIKDFIDLLLKDSHYTYPQQLKEAWRLYKEYEEKILPFSIKNITDAKENLKDIND